jgi:hypothetical protein
MMTTQATGRPIRRREGVNDDGRPSKSDAFRNADRRQRAKGDHRPLQQRKVEHNPSRARKLGGPKIKTKSGYKPVRVTPMQIKKMLKFLRGLGLCQLEDSRQESASLDRRAAQLP